MALEIKWTKRAENSFDSIFEYIKLKFGDSTAKKFASQSFEIFELLSLFPEMGTIEDSTKGILGFVLSEQTTLFYRTTESQIILLNFYNNRRNPSKRSTFYK